MAALRNVDLMLPLTVGYAYSMVALCAFGSRQACCACEDFARFSRGRVPHCSRRQEWLVSLAAAAVGDAGGVHVEWQML